MNGPGLHRAAWPQRLVNLVRTAFSAPQTSRIVHTGRTMAGVYMSPDEALKNATVWACIQYLSRAVAQLPWRVGVETDDGGFKVQSTHPVDYLLHKRPCADYGSFSWRQTQIALALRWGNAYAEIERDARGVAVALWPIHPERVRVRRDDATGALVYDVSNTRGGGFVTLAADEMFHIRGFGEGPVGYNVIEYAAQSIGWAQATQVFGSTFFGEGMNPSIFVEVPGKLTPAAMDIMRGELKNLYRGPKGERTFIGDNGMKPHKLATNPEEAQFIETRQHQVEEICRWFNCPPHKVMHLLRATFSNIEQQGIEVVVDSVAPWCHIIEEEAEYKLFGPANRQNLTTKLNLKGLMRGDAVSRADYFSKRWQTGSMTINDILRAEDENPIGPDGDIRFVPLNFQPLKDALAGPPKPIVPQPGEPVSPPPAKTNGAANGHAHN